MKKSLTLAVGALVVTISAFVSGQTGAKNGEWPHWGADHGNTKYSPLDQINRDNVKDLRVAWRWKSENHGPRPQNNMEGTPLMVGGVLYSTAGFRPNVVAIDGATGETLWVYRIDEGQRGDRAPRSVSRGVEYWTDGKQERILLMTRGYQLVSLDAKTGIPDPKFGRNGVIDLYQDFDQPPPADGVISSTSPAVVVKDVVVIGAAMVGGTRTAIEGKHQRLHPRLRRQVRKAFVDVPHHSAARRVRQRHVAERFVVVYGQHLGLVAILGRR